MKRLRELREERGYSQEQIAAVLRISQQCYAGYETGESELPLRHFIALAEYYGVSADYLIGRRPWDKAEPLGTIYVTRKYTCEELMQHILLLNEHGRQAIVELVDREREEERRK